MIAKVRRRAISGGRSGGGSGASGQRMPMREVAVYHVADGRIVREEFFGMG
jgi:ketosteroid isomerase-like protein